MGYIIMRRKVSDGWAYAEANEHGDVPEYPTEEAAEARIRELGESDLVVVGTEEAYGYYRYGMPVGR